MTKQTTQELQKIVDDAFADTEKYRKIQPPISSNPLDEILELREQVKMLTFISHPIEHDGHMHHVGKVAKTVIDELHKKVKKKDSDYAVINHDFAKVIKENKELRKEVERLEQERDAFYCRHLEEDDYISQILESCEDYIEFFKAAGGRNHLIMAEELEVWAKEVEQLAQSPVSKSLQIRDLEQQAKGIKGIRFSRVDAVELLRRQGSGHSFEDESLVHEELKIAEKILILKANELHRQAQALKEQS